MNLTNNDVDDVVYPPITITLSQTTYSIFRNYLDHKYSNNFELIDEHRQSEIEHVFRIGIQTIRNSMNATSSTSLIPGKIKIRKDESIKLARLALTLENHPLYPNFKPRFLKEIVSSILPLHDKRTIQKYLETITRNSTKNITQGTYDVSLFCSLIPSSIKERDELHDDFSLKNSV